MKNIFIALLFCLIQYTPLFAQYQITILDKETNQPVAFANIYYPDSKTGTIANEKGMFSLNTQRKSILLRISSIGYQTYLEILNLENEKIIISLEPSIHELQEVVIADNSSKLQGENVVNVEKVNLHDNTEMQGISLSQKLSEVSGISNFSTGAGIGKPVVRGLSGNRVAVFSQGIRIENQQWGDEHGLGLDENGYEEVEIIKGPASLLYGGDALGGVLYFTDERYAKENSVDATVTSEYNTNTNGWRNTGGFKISKNRLHWNLFAGYTSHEDYKDGDNNFVDNSRFNTADVKTSLAYIGNKFISSLKYSFLNEQYGLLPETDIPLEYQNGRTPKTPRQTLYTHLFSNENTFFFNNESKLKIDLGYVSNNRKEFETHDENNASPDEAAALNMDLGTLSYNIKWFLPKFHERWKMIVGGQGMYQTNKNKGEEVLVPDAVTADAGLFATADFYYTTKSYFQVGMRIDGRLVNGKEYATEEDDDYIAPLSKTYTAFNFSTGIYQEISKELSLRFNLASGYRAPNMFELLSHGLHEGTNRFEIGNSSLKTENSYQLDVSLTYKIKHVELFVNPYINYIKNYIYLNPSGAMEENLPVYDYIQTDASLFGGEAGFHFHPHPLDWLHLECAYSSTFGQDNHGNDLPLIPAQKINANIKANFSTKTMLQSFFIYLQNQYVFAQNRITSYETKTASYNLINIGFGFEMKINQQKFLLNMSVNNLFNLAYYDHLSRYKTEGIYNIGRNFNIQLTIPFSWNFK